ncbi:hypothetical protein HMN09_00270800 [Mycena chlorophos]|uniref:DUF6533 domain-containing protein n=1 Tax=Mycena chlorophos TaxID=658473 RepID=A0A8H6TMB5_MYCCL|nr:hypothetical protein HMN09_00270800 [Mycena chlorophos]
MSAGESVEVLARRLQTVRYMHVVDLTILLFDYSLTMGTEISLMWTSRWSMSKALYFMSRYSPIFDVPILVYYSMADNLSSEQCAQLQTASSWGTVFGIAVAEAILVLRTYALSGRSRNVLMFFVSLWLVGISATVVLLVLFEQSVVYGAAPSPLLPGCYMVQGNVIYAGIPFIIVLVNDTVIMAYTLWLGVKIFRYTKNPLITTLFRDGIMYYLFLFVISALNVALMLEAPSVSAQLLNTSVSSQPLKL